MGLSPLLVPADQKIVSSCVLCDPEPSRGMTTQVLSVRPGERREVPYPDSNAGISAQGERERLCRITGRAYLIQAGTTYVFRVEILKSHSRHQLTIGLLVTFCLRERVVMGALCCFR